MSTVGDVLANQQCTITISYNGLTDTHDMIIANLPPVLELIGNKSVSECETLTFTISATDTGGDTITYSAENLPAAATLIGDTFTWMPWYDQVGGCEITFTAYFCYI